MSSAPTRGPVMRPGDDRDFTEIFQRLDDIERIAVIQYVKHNVGDWLNIYVSDDDPDTNQGLKVFSDYNELSIHDGPGFGGYIQMRHTSKTGELSGVFATDQATNQSSLWLSGTLVQTIAGNGPDNFGFTEVVNLGARDRVSLQPLTGGVVEFRDASGNVKVRWTEGTTDLHIPTGGNVIADL